MTISFAEASITDSFYAVEPLRADDIEIPFIDDCPIPKEIQNEVPEYNPYKITPPDGCGKQLDQFG